MAETYKVKDLKISDFQDPNGNTAVNLALEGVGEPVTIFVKDTSKLNVGDELYGNVKEVQSRAGKPYQRFYKEKREDGQFPRNDFKKLVKKEAKEFDSAGAAWGNALTNAVAFYEKMSDGTWALNPGTSLEDMESELSRVIHIAQYFFGNRPDANQGDKLPSDDDMDKAIANGTNTDLGEIPF